MSIPAQIDSFIQEKYIPLPGNIKVIIGIVLIVLPVVFFVFGSYMPKSEEIEGLVKKKKQLTNEIKIAKNAAANLDHHKAEMENTKQQFEELTTLLPSEKEIPNLLRSISDLGKGAGLDFVSFTPGGQVARDFYSEIPVGITIHGPYHSVGYFLSQVSKLDRIVTVNNIQLGTPKKVGGEIILMSNCRLVTYMFTNKKVTPKKQ